MVNVSQRSDKLSISLRARARWLNHGVGSHDSVSCRGGQLKTEQVHS